MTTFLDPTQTITPAPLTVQRIVEFESGEVRYVSGDALLRTMVEGGYDVVTITRPQGGRLTVHFGWEHGQ